MRYLRKFTGDDITPDDLVPIPMAEIKINVPAPAKRSVSSSLADLPIRVKTRFRGKGKRVVSTPIFDLVTPIDELHPPPRISEQQFPYTCPLPPSPPRTNTTIRSKRLPPLPSKRHVSTPSTTSYHDSKESLSSEISGIIQIYTDLHPSTLEISPAIEHHHNTPSITPTSSSSSLTSSPPPSIMSNNNYGHSRHRFSQTSSISSYSYNYNSSTPPKPYRVYN